MAKMTDVGQEVAQRVRLLIDRRDDGNISAASRRTELPHTVLFRMYKGRTADPAISHLASIARAYGVSIDWLVAGGALRSIALTTEGDLGFGDTPADALIQWLEDPVTRRKIPLQERMRMGLNEALENDFPPDQFQLVAAWCYLKLLEKQESDDVPPSKP